MPLSINEKIKNYLEQLNFTRESVATDGKGYKKLIKEVESFIQDLNASQAGALYKQLGIWYTYYQRQAQPAIKYLQQYRTTLAYDGLEYAEITNDIGRAHTIDGSYKDTTLFQEAGDIFRHYHNNETDAYILKKAELGIAYSLHQLGLMYHRQSKNTDAQIHFTEAGKIYLRHDAKISYAETLHLLGVSYLREKRIADAVRALEAARQCEMDFQQANPQKFVIHYMSFITGQSLADAYRQLAVLKHDKELLIIAENLLSETYSSQNQYYGEDEAASNADIAKTLQFWGENLYAQQNYTDALQLFSKSLQTKLKVYQSVDHPLVKITLDSIKSLLDKKVHPKAYGKLRELDDQYHLNLLPTVKAKATSFLFTKNAQTLFTCEKYKTPEAREGMITLPLMR
jgi:tetratricopeptide (TPR) repeat protein